MWRLMKWILSCLTGLLLLGGAVALALSLYIDIKLAPHRDAADRFPKVVGMPADAVTPPNIPPYRGAHPSLLQRPPDPFDYPIALGSVGPSEPLYSGTPQYPFLCRTEESGLGQPLVDNQEKIGIPVYGTPPTPGGERPILGYSKDCLLPSRAAYYYNRVGTREFFPLQEANGDIAKALVDGREVDFIVRVETGTINRFIYQLAALKGPDERLAEPNPGNWNRRLVYQFRGGVGIGHRQGRVTPPDLLERRYEQLRLGYAVAYSSGNQTSNHYNPWLAEETAMRVKRQFNALYGDDLYTVGIGGSGGALQQYLFAQNLPGLIDAAIPLYSYPDMVTQTIYAFDCELLEYYFDVTASENQKWRSWENRQLIEGLRARSGFSNPRSLLYDVAMLFQQRRPHLLSGMSECVNGWRGLVQLVNNPKFTHYADRFAPTVNDQVHWTHWDDLRDFYGSDAAGFARQTWDNVGVQYGLAALRRGQITPEEFLHLNAHIGSWKPPVQMQQENYWKFGGNSDLFSFSPWSHQNMHLSSAGSVARRTPGDLQAMQAAYRAGLVFVGKAQIPIIDVRHYLEEELNMHHSSASFTARQRMLQGQGSADNQSIWIAKKTYTPVPEAFAAIDLWMQSLLASEDRDPRRHKPAAAEDRCFDAEGGVLAAGPQVWNGHWNQQPEGACLRAYPIYSESRAVAGAPFSGDLFKCQLQSVDQALARGLYGPTGMGSYREALMRVFPEGVCDYSLPDLGRPQDLFRAPEGATYLSLKPRDSEAKRTDVALNAKSDG